MSTSESPLRSNPEELFQQANNLREQAEASFSQAGHFLSIDDEPSAFAALDTATLLENEANILMRQYEEALQSVVPGMVQMEIVPNEDEQPGEQPFDELSQQAEETIEITITAISTPSPDTDTQSSTAITITPKRTTELAKTSGPDLNIVFQKNGQTLFETSGVIFMSDPTTGELAKIHFLQSSLQYATDLFLTKQIAQYGLRRAINTLAKVDVDPEKRYIKSALRAHPQFALIAAELSDDLMMELGYLDVDTCAPDRMAAYIRRSCFELVRADNQMTAVYAPREKSSKLAKLSALQEKLDDIFCHLIERSDDDHEFIIGVITELNALKQYDELKSYIRHALSIMEKDGFEVAENLLSFLRRNGLIRTDDARQGKQRDLSWRQQHEDETEYWESEGTRSIIRAAEEND